MGDAIKKLLNKVAGGKAEPEVFVPEHESQGHYSTNIALRLASIEKKKPLELAEELKNKIQKSAPKGFFDKVEVAAPGFINFWISQKTLRKELEVILKNKNFGKSDLLKGGHIMVEYTDPNPFKQFHIGHLMTNVIGESIARLNEALGATVLRVNYQGDVGLHVAKAVWGMKELPIRHSDEKMPDEKRDLIEKMNFLGKAYAFGSLMYEGKFYAPEESAKAKDEIVVINEKIYAKSDTQMNELYNIGRKWSLDYFETLYTRLGTKFDHYFFESEIAPFGLEIVRAHPQIFPESQGAIIFPGEQYGLHNRVFVNSQGLPTYEAKELGLNRKKFDLYHPDASFVVTANEINEYFRVVKKAMEFVMPDVAEKTTHLGHGMLRLPTGKMSSRKGSEGGIITAESLIDEVKIAVRKKIETRENLGDPEREEIAEAVALAAIRYSILKQGIGNDIIFDIGKSIAFNGDSGPYLQYTYARLRSILRNASAPGSADTNTLRNRDELDLVRKMMEFQSIVENAAEHLAPHYIAKYLFELANALNRFYETTPVLKEENKDRKNALLLLVAVTASVLKTGLGLLGIKTLEEI